jgi:hypothetical protein
VENENHNPFRFHHLASPARRDASSRPFPSLPNEGDELSSLPRYSRLANQALGGNMRGYALYYVCAGTIEYIKFYRVFSFFDAERLAHFELITRGLNYKSSFLVEI